MTSKTISRFSRMLSSFARSIHGWRKSTARLCTIRIDSPAGALNSICNCCTTFNISSVYVATRSKPSHWPWDCSTNASVVTNCAESNWRHCKTISAVCFARTAVDEMVWSALNFSNFNRFPFDVENGRVKKEEVNDSSIYLTKSIGLDQMGSMQTLHSDHRSDEERHSPLIQHVERERDEHESFVLPSIDDLEARAKNDVFSKVKTLHK